MCYFFVVGTMKSLGILFVEFLEEYQASNSITAWALGILGCCMSLLGVLCNLKPLQLISSQQCFVLSSFHALSNLLSL